MNEVYVDISKEDYEVKKYFKDKYISVEELIGLIIELDYELEKTKEELKEANKSDKEKEEDWHWNKVDEIVDEMLMEEKNK